MVEMKSFEQIEGLIPILMQGAKIPSIAIGVIKEGKMIYSKAFGGKLLKTNAPATVDTLYGIGSCTKSFTTLAILQLADKGLLDINDPVSKYLPLKIGMKDNTIKIKHLMSHSSGIPSLGVATVLIKRISDIEETFVPLSNTDDFMMHVNSAQNEIADIPGKRYFYNNGAFALLGLIIEKLSGELYEDYIKKNILTPLEMTRSIFTREEFEKDGDTMTAYFTDKDKNFKETIHPFDKFIYAAGGLLSSVNELSNYLIMCMNDGKFKDKQIIKSAAIKQWWKPQIETLPGFFGKQQYAFGWATIEEFFGETIVQHGGSTAVSSAMLAMIPEKKFGVIILGNVGDAQGSILVQVFLAALLGKNPQTDLPALRLDSKLSKFVGEYQTYKGITKISISKTGLSLLGKFEDYPEIIFPIIPLSDAVDDFNFYFPIGTLKMPVVFEENTKTGQIDLYYERNRFHKIGPLKKSTK